MTRGAPDDDAEEEEEHGPDEPHTTPLARIRIFTKKKKIQEKRMHNQDNHLLHDEGAPDDDAEEEEHGPDDGE
jgi:hypothetical protein